METWALEERELEWTCKDQAREEQTLEWICEERALEGAEEEPAQEGAEEERALGLGSNSYPHMPLVLLGAHE